MIELEDRLYTSREVAKILRCHPRHICILVKRRELPAYVNGKMYLFGREHILGYLESHKVGAKI